MRISEMLLKKKFARGALVSCAAFLIILVLHTLHIFHPLEWKSWDLRLHLFSNPSRASRDIVLFLIDQYSLDIYEKQQALPWPWPRELYAYIIQYCKAGGARACIFDLIFSEVSRYGIEDDQNLARAMTNAGNVFLTIFLSEEESEIKGNSSELLKKFSLKRTKNEDKTLFPMKSATTPVEQLLDSARGIGNVQLSPDNDGIYRRLPLLFSYRNLAIPALPLAVAEFLTGERVEFREEGNVLFKGKRIPLDSSGQMIIRFYGPQGTYPTYSIASIINSWALMNEGKSPQIPAEDFAGKIVLVGGSAPGLYDLRSSPFSSVNPGVEIQATVIDNLLKGDFIALPGRLPTFILIFFFALFTGIGVSLLKSPWKISIFFLLCLSLPAGASCCAYLSDYWLDFVSPEFTVLLSFITASLLNYSIEGRQRRFIKNVFRFYLSPPVIDMIMKNPDLLQLGGEKREITSFFSDIEGFTSVSESLSPEELVSLLNSFLSEMSDIILSYQGTLDKYEGDAIVAFWNAPLDQPDHALNACRAALKCQKKLAELRPHFKERSGHEFFMRIGINSGPAVVGNMGSHNRFDYTAMGDTVNLAARLEGACKQYTVPILIGEKTFEKVKDRIIAREVDIIRVVGKRKPVRVFEIRGEKGEVLPSELERISSFHDALQAYRSRAWGKAQSLFQELEHDMLAQSYIDRCKRFAQSPPPEDWDGVYDLKMK